MKFIIKGLTNNQALAPFINAENGYVTRPEGRMEKDVIRQFVFGLARTLKDAGFNDFKVERSPYFIGQTRLFWNWLNDNYRRLVDVNQARPEEPKIQQSYPTSLAIPWTTYDLKPEGLQVRPDRIHPSTR